MTKPLVTLLEELAKNGYGVAWHPHKEFRPFCVEVGCDVIEFWHDPEGCGSEDFETAVRATYKKMLSDMENE